MVRDNLIHMPRLSLGDATRVFGLTPRAIRFYEEKGMIRAGRDRLNNRFFEPVARERLGWIATLRAAGVAIPEIKHVLQGKDEADLRARARLALDLRRQALRADLEKVETAAANLAGEPRSLALTPRAAAG